MKITVINGPNINMLGIREKEIYGKETYSDLISLIEKKCDEERVEVDIFQSNHEGDIIDKIQKCYNNTDAIIINAGGYTHTSIAILDALKAVNIMTVEVHISDTKSRENFRKNSYISLFANKKIEGKGLYGYIEAIEYVINQNNSK